MSADGKPRVKVDTAPKNKAFMDGLTPKQKEIVDDLKPADRNTIVPLLGKTVGKTADTSITLPEGYFWYKRSDGSLTVLRQDKKLPELVVQKEKGQPAKLTLKADGEALEGYQPRISGPTSSLYQSIEKGGGPKPGDLSYKSPQVQHLNGDSMSQKNPLILEGLKRKVVTQDDPDNLLLMPGPNSNVPAGTLTHNGSHPKFDEDVALDLVQQEGILKAKYGSLDRVPNDVLERTIRESRGRARQNIESGKVRTRINPITGKLELASIDFPDMETEV